MARIFRTSLTRDRNSAGFSRDLPGKLLACVVLFLAGALTCSPAAAQVVAGPKISKGNSSAPVQFVDFSARLGVHFEHESSATSQKYLLETMGSGVALFDCDGDGRLDIFFVNGARIDDPMAKGTFPVKDGPKYWNRLYHQKADGTFEDITEKSGLAGEGYGIGVATGDYDNDGREDLYVTGFPHNHLYHNRGDCTFEDVTEKAGVGASGWSASAAFVDVDNDGRLDLIVTRYLDWSFDNNPYCGEHQPGHRAYCNPDIFRGVSPLLYHNEGDGRFTDITQKAGLSKLEGKGLGVAIADMDRDGYTDVVIANDSVREFLLHNEGGGIFKEIAVQAGSSVDEDGRVYAGMGADFADYDNDGNPDIVITDLSDQKYALYRNSGNGNFFSYETVSSGLGIVSRPYAGWGVKFFDYDNDGRKDLFIAQGHVLDTIALTFPHLRYLQPPLLLHNDTGTKFSNVSAESGEVFRSNWAGRGLAVGDLDNDGAIDVVITTNNGPAYILHNEGGNRNHWLTLRLVGRKSNRDGIGAEIKLVSAAGAQYATVTTSGSYLSASDPRVHFGLGEETSAKYIEVHWPSGVTQRLNNVASNQILTITESDSPVQSRSRAPAADIPALSLTRAQ